MLMGKENNVPAGPNQLQRGSKSRKCRCRDLAMRHGSLLLGLLWTSFALLAFTSHVRGSGHWLAGVAMTALAVAQIADHLTRRRLPGHAR